MSIRLLWRRGLLVLAGATALAVAAPAVASAAPTVGLVPNSVTAGSTAALEIDETFSPTLNPGDTVTTSLPNGLLANADLNGGVCLTSPNPQAGCGVGSATANGNPFSMWLVAGPNPGHDVAGLALCTGTSPCATPLVTADVTNPTGSGLVATVTNPIPALSTLNLMFSALRMPTSCPATPANITVSAAGSSGSAGLTVQHCSSLAYNPSLSATVKADSGPGSGAEVISTITQPNAGTESATKSSTLVFGQSLAPNATAVGPCFASPCQVGTATATSPLVPSAALSDGTVTLGGTLVAPTLTITFPLLNVSLVGAIDLVHNSVTFSNEPDVPLSSLRVDVTGPASGGKAFTTTCQAATLTGSFTGWSGATKNASAPIQYQGCPSTPTVGKPHVSGSISGLPAGHPKLKVTVKHGSNAPNVKSVVIKAPSGLKFHSKCTKKHGKVTCKGLAVSGTIKTVKASGGSLTIVLKKAVGKVTVKAKGPALTESKALQTKVKHHKVKKLVFSVKVKDAKGTTTKLSLKLKA